MDEVAIFPATLRDVFGVWALERACFARDAWGPLEISYALLTAAVRLKAMLDARLVGFTVGEDHRREGVGWIATIGVHPDHQRRGIGKQLLAAAEARLTQPVLKLTVRASNAPAIALYHGFGYQLVDRIPHYYTGGEDGLVMEKRRASPPRGTQGVLTPML
jgi:ribosomal-protein-alanine N-acetyltransferase